jgi:saccharopine dehydrogenase-like NADP-dependent oxidoreductase
VFRDGEFAMVPPLSPDERLEVRFPPPVGRLVVDTTLHSEVATLPEHFAGRGVREVTFRQGFEREFMERLGFLARLGLADTEAPAPAARNGGSSGAAIPAVSPRQVLLALLARFPAATVVGRPARHEVLRALVRGSRRGREVAVTADCHAGPRSGFGVGPDSDTGAPPSIAVQLMLSGKLPIRPGVWAPEEVIPVEPFLEALERRGMRVTRRSRPAGRAGRAGLGPRHPRV